MKRIIDASKGWPQQKKDIPVQQAPKQVRREPIYTVTVHPTANLVYQNPAPPQQKKDIPVQQMPEKNIQHETRTFDTTGCKTINDVYEKNEGKIKLILE